MGMMESYLDILSESLSKKEQMLDILLEKSEYQRCILNTEPFDSDAFDVLTNEKADIITKLNSLDDGFQALYDRVKAEITSNKEIYADQIQALQKKITVILEKSNHLMALEQRTKEEAGKKFAILKKEVQSVKKNQQYASNYYKTMNKFTNDSVFVDQKK